jgi:hypothetical protein
MTAPNQLIEQEDEPVFDIGPVEAEGLEVAACDAVLLAMGTVATEWAVEVAPVVEAASPSVRQDMSLLDATVMIRELLSKHNQPKYS